MQLALLSSWIVSITHSIDVSLLSFCGISGRVLSALSAAWHSAGGIGRLFVDRREGTVRPFLLTGTGDFCVVVSSMLNAALHKRLFKKRARTNVHLPKVAHARAHGVL